MNPVFRGIAIYLFLLLIFRIMGKRSLSETTTFEFILLLIISEVTQQALVGKDFSITGSTILIGTLMSMDLILSKLKDKFKFFGKVAEGMPLVIVDKGAPLKKRMVKSRVDEEDVMEAARLNLGLERMDQIKYAVLEKDGSISIIPFETK
ncbi:MAG TPA: YetF domain-containing protein [Flavitalea sp.]|nr:YetF domain-containing protein [Flavitalea sp.]